MHNLHLTLEISSKLHLPTVNFKAHTVTMFVLSKLYNFLISLPVFNMSMLLQICCCRKSLNFSHLTSTFLNIGYRLYKSAIITQNFEICYIQTALVSFKNHKITRPETGSFSKNLNFFYF